MALDSKDSNITNTEVHHWTWSWACSIHIKLSNSVS